MTPPIPSAAALAQAAQPIPRYQKLLWAGIVLAAYGYIGTWGQLDFGDLMGYYNMQADAFARGQLYIAQTPGQNFLMDMIPFEGHYYLQWGPFPALLHLAPRLARVRLSDRVACILAGWLTALVFLEMMLVLQARYFPAAPPWACVWFFFAFAFGTPTVIVALRGTIYHESIAWAALFVLAAFLALLRYAERRSVLWTFLAGLAIALATATRITQGIYALGLFGGMAAVLYRAREKFGRAAAHLALFCIPVLGSVVLMLAYNRARFHSPWEYGLKYVPTVDAQKPPYKLHRVAENFRHYVLAPIRIRRDVPWLEHIGWQPLIHTGRAEDMSSMFLASPFLLLGGLAWKLFRKDQPAVPRILGVVAAGSGLVVFLQLLCFSGTSRRYMQDLFPEFMILAFLGVAAHARAAADWRPWQKPAWAVFAFSALVHIHLVFFQPAKWAPLDANVMKTYVAWSPVVRRVLPGHQLDALAASDHNELGIFYMNQGHYAHAIPHFEQAQKLLPHSQEIGLNLKMARQLQAAQKP